MPQSSPTVYRRRLVAELRQRREKMGLSGPQVAKMLNFSTSKISRLEKGQILPNREDVAALLDLYKISEPERKRLLDIVPLSSATEWWEEYSDAIPPGYREYLGFESGATEMWQWQALLVPGILQTKEYMVAVIEGSFLAELTPRQVRRRVELRMARKERILQQLSTSYHVIIDEAVFSRLVGKESIMRGQLQHILEIAEKRELDLRVLLHRQGFPGGYIPDFILLRFPTVEGLGELHPDILYREDEYGGGVDTRELEAHRKYLSYKRLAEVALSHQDSLRFIRERSEEWD